MHRTGHLRSFHGFGVVAVLLASASASAQQVSPPPDFSGIWQKGPLALFQPVEGMAAAVKPLEPTFN